MTVENSTSTIGGSEVTVIDNNVNSTSGSDTAIAHSLSMGIFIAASTLTILLK